MKIKPSQASEIIVRLMKARLVPMLEGSPGTGKSQIVHQIAQEYGLKVIDLRLSQCDPCDLMGFPSVVEGRACYLPMTTFPIESDVMPEGYSGWLLFLDEFNSAPPAVQAAAYKLVLDRMVGNHHLHKNVAIVCAGNKDSDGAIVMPMSTALQSRLVHMELDIDHADWMTWAAKHGIHPMIRAYLRHIPRNLHKFDANHTDKTYPCPRTWEFASRVLGQTDFGDPLLLPILSGTVSEGTAREFIGYCKIKDQLPEIDDIIRNPEGIHVPDEPGVLYALSSMLSHQLTSKNAEQALKYVFRLGIEFQTICIKETIQRDRALLAHPAIQKWVTHNALELM